MITLRRRAWLGALLLVALGCTPAPPRNLVLISLDTLVPGRMSAYGNERPTTPHIDRLLGDAVRFTSAFTPAPWTLPAHAAMLTGRYPSSLAPDPNDRRLYGVAPLLSTRFQEKQYRTAAVTGGRYVSRGFGADRGFDSFEKGDVELAVKWLRENAAQPFFLFFHTYYAHAGYKDRRFIEGMDGGRLKRIYHADIFSYGLHNVVCCKGIDATAQERDFLRAFYDGGVAAVDEMVGQLVEALRELDVLDRTTIVITSDHGEEFWEHTGRGAYHGHSLYDELLRIPLIWYEPGMRSAGSAPPQPVSLIDIVPTVAARFGLEVEEELDGVDLSPLLDGDVWTVERALFAEAVRHGPERRSVRTSAGKLIVAEGPQRGEGEKHPVPVRAPRELYLPDDAGEQRNRIAEAAALEQELAELLAEREQAARPPAPDFEPPVVGEEDRARLRAIGYLEP